MLKANGRTTVVQCKRWRNARVGVVLVRELYGVMTAEAADSCILVTSGTFTPEAEAFARGKPIELLDGSALLKLIPQTTAEAVTTFSSSEPLQTPTCPACGGTRW